MLHPLLSAADRLRAQSLQGLKEVLRQDFAGSDAVELEVEEHFEMATKNFSEYREEKEVGGEGQKGFGQGTRSR